MSPRLLPLLAFGAGLALASGAAAGPTDPTGVLKITLDQAKVARLPTGATTLVVGNPAIADVTMLKAGLAMVVTGKGYGEPNLIALDAQGNILDEKKIDVEPTRSMLVVQRGDARESYWCNPVCMPTVQVGDEEKVFDEARRQVDAHSQQAQQGGAAK